MARYSAAFLAEDPNMRPIHTTLALLYGATFVLAQAQSRPSSIPQVSAATGWALLEKQISEDKSGPNAVAKKWWPVIEAFAKEHAGSEDALSARLWLLQQTWWERQAGTMNDHARVLAEQILTDYPRSPQLAKLGEYVYVFNEADRTRILGGLTTCGVAAVEASCLHALGTRELRSKDAQTRALGLTRMKLLAENYDRVPIKHTTYGALAKSHANPHDAKALAVGATAPEIVGVDADGKALKLSDQRGKVVVLDFWGFW